MSRPFMNLTCCGHIRIVTKWFAGHGLVKCLDCGHKWQTIL